MPEMNASYPASTTKTPSWYEQIRRLCITLEESDIKIDLLHQIDLTMRDPDTSLKELFAKVVQGLLLTSRAQKGHLYIKSFGQLILSYSTSPLNTAERLRGHDYFVKFESESPESNRIKVWHFSEPHFPKEFERAASLLLAPIEFNNELFGIIFLENENTRVPESDYFRGIQVRDFVEKVLLQLDLALSRHFSARTSDIMEKTLVLFFKEQLKPQDRLVQLAAQIKDFLPNFHPFKITSDLEAQILFYYPGKTHPQSGYLSIKATTGKEILNTRVSVSESISGILIEQPDLDYYLCDPRDHKERYKSYLGQRKNTEIKAELVVPVKIDGAIIALLNLESEYDDIFHEPHVAALKELAHIAAPVIRDLRQTLEQNLLKQKAILYGLDRALSRIASLYRHGLKSPLSSYKLEIDRLKNKLSTTRPELVEILENLEEGAKEIEVFHNKFTMDITRFASYGAFSINSIINETKKLFTLDALQAKENISLEFEPRSDYEVFCSPFLGQHFYNIIANSIYAIREKMTDPEYKGMKGVIRITTSLLEDSQEKSLNKRCVIKIRDNGTGIPAENQERVFEPNFSTKSSGSGLGLFAAREYLESLGGSIFVESQLQEFFEVIMILDIYDENIHSARR